VRAVSTTKLSPPPLNTFSSNSLVKFAKKYFFAYTAGAAMVVSIAFSRRAVCVEGVNPRPSLL
jgi:hypothetical protein